jgi:hypothetical protein
MGTWESVLLGIVAIVFIIWMFPGVKHRMQNSPKGSTDDWKGLLIPLLLVVLFVMFLISIV